MYQTIIERKWFNKMKPRSFLFFISTILINYPSGWDYMRFIDDDLTSEEVGQLLGGN